jgi:lipopolysaccharide biosynthesis regulator YciM
MSDEIVKLKELSLLLVDALIHDMGNFKHVLSKCKDNHDHTIETINKVIEQNPNMLDKIDLQYLAAYHETRRDLVENIQNRCDDTIKYFDENKEKIKKRFGEK